MLVARHYRPPEHGGVKVGESGEGPAPQGICRTSCFRPAAHYRYNPMSLAMMVFITSDVPP